MSDDYGPWENQKVRSGRFATPAIATCGQGASRSSRKPRDLGSWRFFLLGAGGGEEGGVGGSGVVGWWGEEEGVWWGEEEGVVGVVGRSQAARHTQPQSGKKISLWHPSWGLSWLPDVMGRCSKPGQVGNWKELSSSGRRAAGSSDPRFPFFPSLRVLSSRIWRMPYPASSGKATLHFLDFLAPSLLEIPFPMSAPAGKTGPQWITQHRKLLRRDTFFYPEVLGLSMEGLMPALDTPLFGGLTTWLFEGPK